MRTSPSGGVASVKIAEVSSQLILDILLSPAFKQALSKAGNRASRTGHETGFVVMKKYASDDFGVPWVLEGGCGGMWKDEAPREILSVGKRRFWHLLHDTYPLFDIHFHTAYDQLVIPSLSDLHGIHGDFMCEEADGNHYEVRTVVGIGQVDTRANVELLLVQPLMPFFPGEGEEAMLEQLLPASTTEEVARLLTDSGAYKAEVVHFHRWQLAAADQEKVRKFAFTPRRWR
jgi:hypothetical protein